MREGHRLGAETDTKLNIGTGPVLETGIGAEWEPKAGYKRLRPN